MATSALTRPSMDLDEQSDQPFDTHFVRALHDFFPANAPEDNASGCLFFQRGAIIEVYNRDASGWWDGVCEGLRGWFPSNYVGQLADWQRHSTEFDDSHPQYQDYLLWRQQALSSSTPLAVSPTFVTSNHVNHVMTSPTTKVDMARAVLEADRQQHQDLALDQNLDYLLEDVTNRILDLVDDCQHDGSVNIQMSIFRVVSSIRSVLTAANTVTKDSPLLKSFPELARQRKTVLAILRKLVLKGKQVRARPKDLPAEDPVDQQTILQQDIPELANQLTVEISVFESILRQSLPMASLKKTAKQRKRHSHRSSHSQSSRHSSSSSFSDSDDDDHGLPASTSLRQQLVAARLSSTSLIAKAVPLYDAEHILATIHVHQSSIDALVPALVQAVAMFLAERKKANSMLETTRKVVEAVRNFLAVVEHVCSNVGHLDYKHHSVIPEDPLLVALVLAKEDVYTAITNMVTAVRALTAPSRHRNSLILSGDDDQEQDKLEEEEDQRHLETSCANVQSTIQHCTQAIRQCLAVDSQEHLPLDSSEMRDRLENSLDLRRQQTLSVLGRKVTSLNALQRRYDTSDPHLLSPLLDDKKIEALTVGSPSSSTTTTSTPHSDDLPHQRRQSTDSQDTTHTSSSILSKRRSSLPVEKHLPPQMAELPPPLPHAPSSISMSASSSSSSSHQQLDQEQDIAQLAVRNSLTPSIASLSSEEPDRRSSLASSTDSGPLPSSAFAHSVLQGYQRHRTQSNPSKLPERSGTTTRAIRSFHGRPSRMSDPRAGLTTARSSVTSTSTSSNATRHSTNSSALTSNRSSVDSLSNMTPLTTPEALKPVQEIDDDLFDDVDPAPPCPSTTNTPPPSRSSLPLRQRSSSIFNGHTTASKRMLPLPPMPPSINDPVKIGSSKSTPTNDPVPQRRTRGMSVSALRVSFKNGKSDPPEPPLKHQPSQSSIHSNERSERSERQSMVDAKPEEAVWFLRQRTFSDEELLLNAQGQVTGATIEALIEQLTLHEKAPDIVLTRAFFYNFRLFTSPLALVQLLSQRFRLASPTEHPDSTALTEAEMTLWKTRVLLPVRLRVYNVIKTWMESYYRPDQDHPAMDPLLSFAENDMKEAMPGPAKRMVNLIRQTFQNRDRTMSHSKMSYAIWSSASSLFNNTNASIISLSESTPTRPPLQSKTSSMSLTSGASLFSDLSIFGGDSSTSSVDSLNFPPIILTRSLRNTLRKAIQQNNLRLVHINDFDCTELARQLTSMESALFCQVTPYELIGQEFKKKLGESTAIHVKAMILKSTQITSWVSDSILRETEVKRRVQMIKFWIKVADCCLQLNNYNTLMAIRSALDSTGVRRLKRTWDAVSSKYHVLLDPVYRATDSSRNFAEYRSRLKMAVAPCLPFLGVYLTDVTFIDDGNSNTRATPSGTSLINVDKHIKTTRVLNEIDQFQIPYRLQEVEEIQAYIAKALDIVDTNEQIYYEKSLLLEPREEFDLSQTLQHLT
ncbi:ras GEF [Hesseltinella vesiculosa]|uniref:Ras GEF n=1 Tax=Hesseltinella vesiculosa TaxID=101127 RepID=A0A1X2GXA3_9FUNG|nr:ras GEF [Hesseltinella vesiculosa]